MKDKGLQNLIWEQGVAGSNPVAPTPCFADGRPLPRRQLSPLRLLAYFPARFANKYKDSHFTVENVYASGDTDEE